LGIKKIAIGGKHFDGISKPRHKLWYATIMPMDHSKREIMPSLSMNRYIHTSKLQLHPFRSNANKTTDTKNARRGETHSCVENQIPTVKLSRKNNANFSQNGLPYIIGKKTTKTKTLNF
jgi:hypothetical protein